jgi:transketolase
MSATERRPSTAEQMGRMTTPGPFATGLLAAAERRSDVVAVTADSAKYTDLLPFVERYPDRFVDVGIAEQNLIGVAAGLAMSGYTPVATTFAVFATRRALDFIAIQCALTNENVKIVAGLPGICSTFGPTHQGIDDLAHMRVIPGMTVIDPCDPFDMEQATIAAIDHDGPVYLRQLLGRHEPPVLDPARHPFVLGKARLLRAGSDVGIVASSIMVAPAVEAAEQLAAEGVSAAVLQVSTLKPFDGDAVAELAAATGRLVTAENHSVMGALHSAVAESLVDRGVAARVAAVGMQDEFGVFGTRPYVAEQHGLTTAGVLAACRRLVPG